LYTVAVVAVVVDRVDRVDRRNNLVVIHVSCR
jgi:hypothetical protein